MTGHHYLGSVLRWGEMAALQVGRIGFLRRRLVVAESVTLVDGVQTWGAPKSYERREVPIPRFLADELVSYVAGKNADDLVFTGVRGGGALRVPTLRRAAFDQAAAEVGVPGLRPHDLRHTAASLAIASGATVKVVQRMLGHASATVTCWTGTAISMPTTWTTSPIGRTLRPKPSAEILRTSGELILLPDRQDLAEVSPVIAGL